MTCGFTTLVHDSRSGLHTCMVDGYASPCIFGVRRDVSDRAWLLRRALPFAPVAGLAEHLSVVEGIGATEYVRGDVVDLDWRAFACAFEVEHRPAVDAAFLAFSDGSRDGLLADAFPCGCACAGGGHVSVAEFVV